MASRQGLKLVYNWALDKRKRGRQWNGFPSGIETLHHGIKILL